TVTYPDGTQDHVTVTVVTKDDETPDEVIYEPVSEGVNHDYGTPTTSDEVIGSVTIPGYPTTGEQPVVTVDNPNSLPNGTTPGTVNVPVTITYPDGSVDHITVPVTTGEKPTQDKVIYEPTSNGVNHDYGTPTTSDDVIGSVTIPGYPTTGEQPVITVNNPGNLPNGTTPGTVNVPVTVTYPDGSVDHIDVPVTTGKKPAATATKYEPTSGVVRKPYGLPTNEG
ncbi:Rib/alpha-like domain-containing protein, partial [Staphylococcus sp. GDX8P80P]|uniref:Rib/alpha-like domain-containing protein n=1 Tax=Staphylococcus sp. GDX8P80P TaxID=2804104 RepID=UPI001FDA0101